MTWHLAVSTPGAEHLVSARLTRHQLPHHYFKILDRCVRRGRAVTRAIPLFPRYIFTWCQGSALSEVRDTFDVVAIVPGAVPQFEIEKLLARAEGGDTIIPPVKAVVERFLPGERVRVGAGPYQGFDAIWACRTGPERVRVLLGMMGRQVPLDLDESILEPAQERYVHKYRPRRRHRDAVLVAQAS
jgi:transcriptional antiterminator RfaH